MEQSGKLNGNELKISVRNLVEFILRSGDIDSRTGTMADPEAMQIGSRMHRKLQKQGGSGYQAEVPLSKTFPCEDFSITVEGRADGIIIRKATEADKAEAPEADKTEAPEADKGKISEEPAPDAAEELPGEDKVTVDEIKGIFRSLEYITEPVPVHLAQAKCYAYFYADDHGLSRISVRMTYVNLDTEEVKRFSYRYTREELEKWFMGVLDEYKKWARFQVAWKAERQASIHMTEFPFSYRAGQRNLAALVYLTISRGKKMFLQAPTGVGKTLAVLFPAVKAIGKGFGDKLFYLTAKTIGRTVAAEGFEHLRGSGLHFKTVIITAKEKICLQEIVECTPEICPYAKGHFDRINEAVYELITSQDSFDRESLQAAAKKYRVCPFELSLDLSIWADGIICDYNYVFAPRAKLKRFFADTVRGDYLFLIDEAHNLVDRGRDMYSASLIREDFLDVKRTLQADEKGSKSFGRPGRGRRVKKKAEGKEEKEEEVLPLLVLLDQGYEVQKPGKNSGDPRLALIRALGRCARYLLGLKKECCDEGWLKLSQIGTFSIQLLNLSSAMEDFLEICEDKEEADLVRNLYFEVTAFMEACDRMDERYLIYAQTLDSGRFMLKVLCADPSTDLEACLAKGRSTVFFSATLLPVDYYKRMLTTDKEADAFYAPSVFDPARRKVLVGADTSSIYRRRTPGEFERTAQYIRKVLHAQKGNYMVFFSSYKQMEAVEAAFETQLPENTEALIQRSGMTETEREDFLEQFSEDREKSLVGFCVMGSIFSEGIDLKNDRLIGAIIVGTGLPQVCIEQELLKSYFDEHTPEGMDKDGFRFAYLCPGMNKVLQAAGRVIRTEEDCGIILLLDERFTRWQYSQMFPREWDGREICSLRSVDEKLENFWKSVRNRQGS